MPQSSGAHRPAIALYQPDIPQNTGTILRLCACLDIAAHIIAPTGFDMSDRALRRAGLDYLDHVAITRHEDYAAFVHAMAEVGRRVVLLTTHATERYTDFAFQTTDVLLLGRESAGAPQDVHTTCGARVKIPQKTHTRSLNIAVAAGMVAAEALRQTNLFPEK